MFKLKFIDFIILVPLVRLIGIFLPKKGNCHRSFHKILIIKLAAVGDTVLVGTVLEEFHRANPGVELHWLVSPINKVLAKQYQGIKCIYLWLKRPGWDWVRLIKTLRKENFDAVVDLEQWSRGSALMAYLTGSPVRIGFKTRGQYRHYLFTEGVEKRDDRHEIKEFHGLISLLGEFPCPDHLVLSPVRDDGKELKVSHFFESNSKKRILLHPGCGKDGLPREWPLENYAVLGNWLINKYQAELVFSAGPEEMEKSIKLYKLLGKKGVQLGGRLSWLETISLMQHMDLIISGNTGIMHVAAAFQKPQIALHGPTNPVLWGPLNPNAVVIQSSCPKCPCLKLGFEYHTKAQSCMAMISIDQVKKGISDLIDKQWLI